MTVVRERLCPHFTGEKSPELFFFFSLNLRVRSEQGNFCPLGLFSGASFVLTRVDNRVLTADDKLWLIMLWSGSSSFSMDTVHIAWLIYLTVGNFCVKKTDFQWEIYILNLEFLPLRVYFSSPQIAVDMAAAAGSDGFDWNLCWVI